MDPWGGLVDDKFIYGIGVSNMKAGDAAYFCAVKTLIDAGAQYFLATIGGSDMETAHLLAERVMPELHPRE